MKHKILIFLNLWRIIPAWICHKINKFKAKCKMDLDFATENNPHLATKSEFIRFAFMMTCNECYRNVLLNRLHRNPIMYVITRMLFSPCKVLYINMPPEKIGGGLYFQHGFSTIVAAESIGERCKIFQQVTVGFNGEGSPVIGNDVTIAAGAIVIGQITVGDGAVIGAGSVVTHDVSPQDIVAGVPARFIKNAEADRKLPNGGLRY